MTEVDFGLHISTRLDEGYQPHEIAAEFEAALAELTGWRLVRAGWWVEDVVCPECGSTGLTGYAGACPLGHTSPLISGHEYQERLQAERKAEAKARRGRGPNDRPAEPCNPIAVVLP